MFVSTIFNDPRIIKQGCCSLDGIRQGEWIFLNPNGTCVLRGKYRDGKMNGMWTWYDNGKPKIYTLYYNGELLGHQII